VLAFEFGEIAGRAYSMFIERDPRALIRNRAFLAKPDIDRQLVLTDYISFLDFYHRIFGTRFGSGLSDVRRRAIAWNRGNFVHLRVQGHPRARRPAMARASDRQLCAPRVLAGG
jgi:hypothetical protein